MYTRLLAKHRPQSGVTLVELIIAISVMTILSVVIVSLIVTWLQQYAATSVRNSLSTDTQAVIRRMNDDVRKSTKLLATNPVSDPNAPTPPGSWTSTSTRLVLAQTPRTSTGAGIWLPGTYTGVPDSIVYYLRSGALYKRIVPVNYTGNVNLPLLTCTSPDTTIGGCASDLKIAENVKSVNYIFYDATGAVTTNAAVTTAIKMTLQLEKQQSGQTITTSGTATMVIRTVSS